MNSYVYRLLSAKDLARFRDLLRVFGEAFSDLPTYQGAVPGDGYLTGLLDDPRFIALAAVAGDEVVGGIAAYELPKFEQERKEIYIYDLAVAEGHRRRGVATGLIGELTRVAAERRAYVIFVQADPEDSPAVALYESFGAREAVYHFDIAVGEGASPGRPKRR